MEQSLLKIETDPEYGREPGGGEGGGGDPARLPILKPGKNCWRIEHADRAAFLVDGAEYFRAFREVAKQAQRSILIIANKVFHAASLPSREKLLDRGSNNFGGVRVALHDG